MADNIQEFDGRDYWSPATRWTTTRAALFCAAVSAVCCALVTQLKTLQAVNAHLLIPTAVSLVYIVAYHKRAPGHTGLERLVRIVLGLPVSAATVFALTVLLIGSVVEGFNADIAFFLALMWVWCFVLGIPVCLLYYIAIRPRRVIREGVHCPRCGYRIDNIKGPNCPECGLRAME